MLGRLVYSSLCSLQQHSPPEERQGGPWHKGCPNRARDNWPGLVLQRETCKGTVPCLADMDQLQFPPARATGGGRVLASYIPQGHVPSAALSEPAREHSRQPGRTHTVYRLQWLCGQLAAVAADDVVTAAAAGHGSWSAAH